VKVAVFSSKRYDVGKLSTAASGLHQLTFLEPRLVEETAGLADGYQAVCLFVNDQGSAPVLKRLVEGGTRFVALRSAGYNHVDLKAAAELGMKVARVPAYSPHAVAEHTVGLILALNRKIHRAAGRVRESNFSLEGLLGFDLHGRTVGVVGTGRIGQEVAEIMTGFGCRLLATDPFQNKEVKALHAVYVELDQLLTESDIITLHCPLTNDTYHMVNHRALSLMKPGVMLINTSRGALIDTAAVIDALKSGIIGYLGLDVYEEEADLFFEDLSDRVLMDDVFARLLTFPNVLITAHQAFFTDEALEEIARVTVENLTAFEKGDLLSNEVSWEQVRA
jgi:D-lactate dehydrogenase